MTISMTRREATLGWGYFFLNLLLLPRLLPLLNGLLPAPLSAGKLNFFYFLLNFLVLSCVFRQFLGRSLAPVKNAPGRFFTAFGAGFGAYYAASLALSLFILRLCPDFQNANDSAIAAMAGQDGVLTIVGTVLLVPLAEELLYRGLLFGRIFARNRAAGYLLSTLVFCLIHVAGYIGVYPAGMLLLSLLQYVPAGLCLGWAYVHSGTIFAPVCIHTVVNLLGCIAIFMR